MYAYEARVKCCGTCLHWQDLADFEHSGICKKSEEKTYYGDECNMGGY